MGHLLADGYRHKQASPSPQHSSLLRFPHGPGYIGSAGVVVANNALAASLRTTVNASHPVTEFTNLVFATANPRTNRHGELQQS